MVFQSTRPRGARLHALPRRLPCAQCFNPRAHAGRDFKMLDGLRTMFHVSIHAPTRGATSILASRAAFRRFQSTRPRGARQKPAAFLQIAVLFQSTRPRGARLTMSRKSFVTEAFQSTRPRGARP